MYFDQQITTEFNIFKFNFSISYFYHMCNSRQGCQPPNGQTLTAVWTLNWTILNSLFYIKLGLVISKFSYARDLNVCGSKKVTVQWGLEYRTLRFRALTVFLTFFSDPLRRRCILRHASSFNSGKIRIF